MILRISDYFSKNFVEDPVGRGRTDAVACAIAFVQQMLNNVPDEGKLYICGIRNGKTLCPVLVAQLYGLKRENGKLYCSFASENLNVVLF